MCVKTKCTLSSNKDNNNIENVSQSLQIENPKIQRIYQKSPLNLVVTWATVCSAIGMSSFLKSTRFTTDEGSASKIIL